MSLISGVGYNSSLCPPFRVGLVLRQMPRREKLLGQLAMQFFFIVLWIATTKTIFMEHFLGSRHCPEWFAHVDHVSLLRARSGCREKAMARPGQAHLAPRPPPGMFPRRTAKMGSVARSPGGKDVLHTGLLPESHPSSMVWSGGGLFREEDTGVTFS